MSTTKDKRYGPRTEERKQQMKLTRCDAPGARDSVIKPEEAEQLRAAVAVGESFKYQHIIDYYRSGFANPDAPNYESGSLVRSINGEGEES